MKTITAFSVLLLCIVSSCGNFNGKRIRGNGILKEEVRKTEAFSAIDIRGDMDVFVSQDSLTTIKIETDENLLEYIDIHEKGRVLVIQPEDGYSPDPSGKIKVFVSAPDMNSFKASGACSYISQSVIKNIKPVTINISGAGSADMELQAPAVNVMLSGAGSVRLKGQTKDFTVKGAGSSNIKCFDLLSENTRVTISGAGNAEVFASVSLNANISGAGTVKYKGNPTVKQNVSGAGSIRNVE